jgi:hypothetical protein
MESGLFQLPEIVDLTDGGEPIIPPHQIVYSSGPRLCLAAGRQYVVKGPQLEVVAAELVGHAMSALVDLPTPKYALARDCDGARHFASAYVEGAIRDVRPFIAGALPFLARVVAFDVWLFNNDRNIGGLVMGAEGLVAIDFEKSWAVRSRTPTVELPTFDHRTLWPRGELGQRMKGAKVSNDFLARIEAATDESIAAAVAGIRTHLPEFTWSESTVFTLQQRRKKIRGLVKEVWP